MARKTKLITIETANRDHGKQFLLTEMPASQGERWAGRAFTGITRSGATVSPGALQSGFAGIAQIGVQSLLSINFQDAEPLMEELMACATIVRDPEQPEIGSRIAEHEIEEVLTRLLIKMEVLELHTGFSLTAAVSRLAAVFVPKLAA